MPSAQEHRVMEILAKLDALGVEHHVVPRFFHLMGHRVRMDALDSVPLLTRYERRETFINAAAKRCLDVALSSVFLLIASPVFLISIFLIKRESKGPAFFINIFNRYKTFYLSKIFSIKMI